MEKYELCSHKDKLLITHLKTIAERSKDLILSKNLNLSLISKEDLANISYLIGISHDFGKASEFFQDYLFDRRKDISSKEKTHSFISAFLGYFLIEKYCDEKELNLILKYVGAFLIRRHHGNLDSLKDCLTINEETNEDKMLEKQLKSIGENKEVERIYKNLLEDFNLNFLEATRKLENSSFNEDFGISRKEEARDIFDELEEKNLSYELFLITELLFSVLVDCDKKDAAGFEINNSIKQIPENCVEEYLEIKRKNNPEKFNPKNEKDKALVELKNQIFDSCVNNENLKKENKIYSITAPTGAGKTLTSFATALKLKYSLENKENYKIHYVLPFTTIIDQNYNVFGEVLFSSLNEKNENDYIMKHHYLATEEIKKQNNDSEETNKNYEFKSYMDELLFIKSWDSALVVSSYVQLLETIIGGKNSNMNKFHNITNSIIILDEVQCISSRYWDVFRDLFKELAEKFNVYFIFLTATQPLIFNRSQDKEEKECIEIANPDKIYENGVLDRVNVEIDLNEKEIDEFFNQFCESESFENRYLFILNTKRSSLELYNKFIKSDFNEDYEIIYLSTNLTPFDRKKKLEKILGKNSPKKYMVVTTQLIEAGVDISSDVCYRDFAPMDSIIQSAGRVNRFGELEDKKGKLILINLRDENKPYSKYVYSDEPVLDWTEEVIEENKERFHSSKDFHDISKMFFENTLRPDKKTKLGSEKLNNNVQGLNFSHDYKFIEDKPTHSIFVLNKDSIEVFENYKKKLFNKPKTEDKWSKEMNEWRGELKRTMKEFSRFTIEVWPKKFEGIVGFLKNDKRFGEEFYYLDVKEFPDLYDSETGFNLDYEQDNHI